VPPLHRRCIDRSLEHCPHLRAEPNIDVRPFPPAWAVTPLLVEARREAGPQHFLARPQALLETASVISFLQICGVTQDEDPKWRRQLRG
jgi:hypothetical protein